LRKEGWPREIYELGCIEYLHYVYYCGACLSGVGGITINLGQGVRCHDHLRREFGNYPRSQRDGEDEGETDPAFAGLI